MSKIFISFLILGSSSTIFAKSAQKKEWTVCKENKDCMVAGYGCGPAYAIHKKFKDEFAATNINSDDCSVQTQFELYKAVCKSSVCELIEPEK